MTKHLRNKIGKKTILRLNREVGKKCANPGCSNKRTHIHHIKEWHIYHTDDEKDMIAVCPSCHDAIHHGALEISDDILYKWKAMNRLPTRTSHLYMQPGKVKIVIGNIILTFEGDSIVLFKIDENNEVRLKYEEGQITLLKVLISDKNGVRIVNTISNHVNVIDDKVNVIEVPGHIKVNMPTSYVEEWVINKMRKINPTYANECITALEFEVISDTQVKLKGHWSSNNINVVIDDNNMCVINKIRKDPIVISGTELKGEPVTILNFDKSVSTAFSLA